MGRPLTVSGWARPSSSSLLTTLLPSGSLRLRTTPCWPRPESTTTLGTTLSWEPPAESSSAFAPSQSPTPEIPTSSGACPQKRKLVIQYRDELLRFIERFPENIFVGM